MNKIDTTKDLNDLCPLIYRCKEPWCYEKFGNYYNCRRYIDNNPRVDSNDWYAHDGWREEIERFK